MARRASVVSRIPTTRSRVITPRAALVAALLLGVGAAMIVAGMPVVKYFAEQIARPTGAHETR